MSDGAPAQPEPPPPRPKRTFLRRTVTALTLLHLLTVLTLWIVMRQAADRWWPATLIAFGPRWIFATPLLLLAPLVLLLHRRALPLLAAAALVAFVPLMDLSLPWRTLGSAGDDARTLRVLTCNVDFRSLRAPALARLVTDHHVDVVACQEWTSAHAPALSQAGLTHTLRDDELFLASRYPIRRAETVGANWYTFTAGAAVRYEIDTPAGTVDFYNVHLASPHHPFDAILHREPDAPRRVQANSDHRRQQLEDLAASVARHPGPVLMAGDFNTPDDSPIFRRTLSPALRDAFTIAGAGFGHTYYARWTRTRIDHILASPDLEIRRCEVLPDVGSPHHPVIAELQWPTRKT